MVVLSNRRLGPTVEVWVPREVAAELLRRVAEVAGLHADARWERELAGWLLARAGAIGADDAIDVSEIAWTPEHFERQRRFLVQAITEAARSWEDGRSLARWAAMIQAHPRDSVQVGRRWSMHPSQ